MKTQKAIALPKGINKKDMKYPSYTSKDKLVRDFKMSSFELWQSGDEWFIPCLLISKSTRGYADRQYAVRVSDGSTGWRLGKGPHVIQTVKIYVRESRLPALEKFLTLRTKGESAAGQIRDRISSRRAQGQQMRAEGRTHWYWNV